tara:strand:+ start:296 stop:610 length:315 start_codon:yes stop_codon:yes gene_type:complete
MSTSINSENNKNDIEGNINETLLFRLKIERFLNTNQPMPYQGFRKAQILPKIICTKGIIKNQIDQMKIDNGFASGSLDPINPRITRKIKNKKLDKLIKILKIFI